jgi:predicted nucleic acid-binding protein
MAFVVVYDANALYGTTVRDLLIRIAQSELVQAKWTDKILGEMLDNLGRKRPDITGEKLGILRERMNGAIRDVLETDYEPLVEGLDLPDPDDRHVLAAAIKAGAEVIVTSNLRDFPAKYLARWDIEAKSPDAFVLDQMGISMPKVAGAIQQIVDSRTRPPQSVDEVLDELERAGLVDSVAALRTPRALDSADDDAPAG